MSGQILAAWIHTQIYSKQSIVQEPSGISTCYDSGILRKDSERTAGEPGPEDSVLYVGL